MLIYDSISNFRKITFSASRHFIGYVRDFTFYCLMEVVTVTVRVDVEQQCV